MTPTHEAASLSLFAPAKINLHLDILKRRPDGFHDLTTIFQALDWGDQLTMARLGSGPDELHVTGPFARQVPQDGRNLVLSIIQRARHELNLQCPVRIALHKTIPVQAGLGGGSSDAAAALIGFAELAGVPKEDPRLVLIAAREGSDCAFFLRGGTQEGWSRGEKLSDVPLRHTFAVLLVVPNVQVSTREAFEALKPQELGLRSDVDGLKHWLAADSAKSHPEVHNTFLNPLRARHPEIGQAIEEISARGALWAQMSGTGSACYGIFKDLPAAQKAAREYSLPAQVVHSCSPWMTGITTHP